MRIAAFLIFLFLLACQEKQKAERLRTPVKKSTSACSLPSKSETSSEQAFVTCEVVAPGQQTLKAPLAGVLLKGEVDWTISTSFNRGDLLFQFDNSKAFKELQDAKELFLVQAIDFNTSLSGNDAVVWKQFLDLFGPASMVPEYPALSSPGQQRAEQLGISSAYDRLRKQENEMRNYFNLAEADGKIAAVLVKPGTRVRKGQPLLITAKSSQRYCYLPSGTDYKPGMGLLDDKGKSSPLKGKLQGNKVVFQSAIAPGTYRLRIPA